MGDGNTADKIIAMLLAGGKGSRLKSITKNMCKPAVPFGGSHRLIDFPLSNCLNSGIKTIGVLTRHHSKTPVLGEMLRTLGQGKKFDGGPHALPEQYAGEYRGTADAVYSRMDFIESFQSQEILILCADHVYKMDYRKMFDFHRAQNADLTIATVEVPWSNTSHFGILNTNAEGRVLEFEEKPEHPKSNLASMGIYIFNFSVLKKYLENDQRDPDSDNDFGKNIIPTMVEDKNRVCAYPFGGYWRDVGTIKSFWQANMDLLSPNPKVDLEDTIWPIDTSEHSPQDTIVHPPTKQGISSRVGHNVEINGSRVEKSILSKGVTLGRKTEIKNSIIFPEMNIADRKTIENEIVCGEARLEVVG